MLIRGVPDAQLAVAVGPPAPDAAADLYGARVLRAAGDGRYGGAPCGGEFRAELDGGAAELNLGSLGGFPNRDGVSSNLAPRRSGNGG